MSALAVAMFWVGVAARIGPGPVLFSPDAMWMWVIPELRRR